MGLTSFPGLPVHIISEYNGLAYFIHGLVVGGVLSRRLHVIASVQRGRPRNEVSPTVSVVDGHGFNAESDYLRCDLFARNHGVLRILKYDTHVVVQVVLSSRSLPSSRAKAYGEASAEDGVLGSVQVIHADGKVVHDPVNTVILYEYILREHFLKEKYETYHRSL